MRDKTTLASYGAHVLGAREAIPAMLQLFKRRQVHATWAAVGLLLFDKRQDLKKHLPMLRPTYDRPELSPYAHLDQVGVNEASDPYHYGLSLADQILSYPGMELASHTFSHYYCLEPGQTGEQFQADLEAAVSAAAQVGVRPRSIVFPRNQYSPALLEICARLGFTAFRGNQENWMYRAATDGAQQGKFRRAGQLLDAYCGVAGDHSFEPGRSGGLVNVPASRFLSPWQAGRRWLEPVRLRRICNALTAAAEAGRSFHLWWHPHNFGADLRENLDLLEAILQHYALLRESHGMVSRTVSEVAAMWNAREAAA